MLLKSLPLGLLIGLLCLFVTDLNASHLTGGNFRFESVSGCTTRVYLDLYYECSPNLFTPPTFPSAPSPNQVFVASDSFCQPPVPLTGWTGYSMQDVTPICPGVVNSCTDPNSVFPGTYIVTYGADYDICANNCPSSSFFTFNYDFCCRTNALSNVSGTGSTPPIHFTGLLENDPGLSNNSPIFNGAPISVLCIGQGGMIDMSAYDTDGDSIWYQLVSCTEDPFQPLTYNAGFSPSQPLGSLFTTNFDSQTGLMSVSGIGGAAGIYQVCVQVNESRNGQYLGYVIRDFQIVVENCPGGVGALPTFDGLQNVSNGTLTGTNNLAVCEGQTLSFDIAFSDADVTDNIIINSNTMAVLDSSSFTSTGTNPAVGTVIWTPGPDNTGQTYTFYVSTISSGCPVPGTHTEVFYITVGGQCLDAAVTNTACNDSTGAIDITLNGINPPLTYLWSNGATTEDISGLPIGQYWVDITNASGLILTDTFFVSASNIALNAIVNPLNCNQSIGALGVNPSGGTAPYTYQWSNGTNGQAIGGLSAGGYSVIVTDAVGCFAQQTFLLNPPDSCYVLIEGTVYNDQNNNCVQDVGELGLPYVVVDLMPGWATITDAQGHYRIQADTGNVSVSVVPLALNNSLCPATGMVNLYFDSYDDDTTGIDFAMGFIPVADLQIQHAAGLMVPGITRFHHIYATNQGNVPLSGTVSATYDAVESLTSWMNPVPSLNDPTNRLLVWNFGPLAPGASTVFTFYTLVDTTATPGDSAKSFVAINPVVGDTTPTNNFDTTCVEIFAAYDPNDKQVSPMGVVAPATGQGGYILPTEDLMEYTVRFQNTGTYPAQYVVIRDTLDSNLQALSFRAAGASHPYSLDFEDDSVLVFTFANINLPDSASDPLASQGFVAFTLQHAGSLSLGSQIENRAAIYFDYNAPIITNTVQNTIFSYPEVAIDSLSADYLCAPYELTAQLSVLGTSPYTYSWNSGTQGQNNSGAFTTPVDSSRWYAVSVTDALGFETVDSAYWEVRYAPVADLMFITSSPYTYEFSSLSPNATTYAWDFGDGNTSQVLNPVHVYDSAGSYQVQLIVQNDCGSDTLIRTVDVFTTSLADDFKRSVKLVPNPFSEKAVIHFANPQAQEYQLKIYTASGKLVHQQVSREGYFNINREGLSAGLYFFQIQGEWEYAAKLMIK